MRRTAVVTCTLSLLVAGLSAAPAAAAGGGTTTVVSRSGIPDAISAGAVDCTSRTPGAEPRHVKGPHRPPLGTGSLELTATKSEAAGFTVTLTDKQLEKLTAAALWTYTATGPTVADFAFMNDGSNVILYTPVLDTSWTRTDLLTASLTWQNTDDNSTLGTGTLAEFGQKFPQAHVQGFGAASFGCSSNLASDFFVDGLEFGLSGDTTTYDFEPLLGTSVTMHLSQRVITYGDPLTVTARLHCAGGACGSAAKNLHLWIKPSWSGHFSKTAQVPTFTRGYATIRLAHPRVNAEYEWRFPGTATYAASRVGRKSETRKAITVQLSDRTVSSGHPVVVTGIVRPAERGDTVQLFRRGKHGPILVATVETNRKGKYVAKQNVRDGHYVLWSYVTRTANNAPGRSPNIQVTVG